MLIASRFGGVDLGHLTGGVGRSLLESLHHNPFLTSTQPLSTQAQASSKPPQKWQQPSTPPSPPPKLSLLPPPRPPPDICYPCDTPADKIPAFVIAGHTLALHPDDFNQGPVSKVSEGETPTTPMC